MQNHYRESLLDCERSTLAAVAVCASETFEYLTRWSSPERGRELLPPISRRQDAAMSLWRRNQLLA